MGTLYSKIVAFPNLLLAAKRASRGKRYRSDVARFSLALEDHLHRLQQELLEKIYCPGASRNFVVREKKPRLISAAPFRDRVVHHALCNVIEPIFERGFVFDSYACRKGKGTHAAIERASTYAKRYRYVLKCDMMQYFPSIDHAILLSLIERRVRDDEVLWLVRAIVKGISARDSRSWYFPEDDLFTPFERPGGLPIGNQTSQFFGNVYLDGLDHYIKEELRLPGYVRYVDDVVVFDNDKRRLHQTRQAMTDFCATRRLRLHPRKCFVAPVAAGFTFLGHQIFSSHRRLETSNVRRFTRRLRQYGLAVSNGQMTIEQARMGIQSWVAHAKHADTARLRQHIFSDAVWTLGSDRNGIGRRR